MYTFVAGKTNIRINSLSPLLDAAFEAFYAATLGDSGVDVDADAFDKAATLFLASNAAFEDHDHYFENFGPLWLLHLNAGRADVAASVWPWALRPALALEAATSKTVHKGTPYYFWGMTVLLAGNLESGYLFMHRSFEEDIRTHGSVTPATPGYALLTLDHERPNQAFRQWVQDQAKTVESAIARYCSDHGRTFNLESLRRRYLALPQFREPVQMYCYSVARSRRMLQLSPQIWEGSFPSQIAFGALLDFSIVIDEALHAKTAAKWKFIEQATALSTKASLGLSLSRLREINGLFITDFAATLRLALAGKLVLADGTKVVGLAASLAIAYGCRNRGAHTIAAVPISAGEYAELVAQLNNVFFLVIETFY